MRILLDTHVWLWLLTDPSRLPKACLAMVTDEKNELFLSVASGWEIAIKYALGKLPLPALPENYVPSRLSATGVQVLEVNMNHVLAVAKLEQHHRDPFDRLIISQARIENMQLMTADSAFSAYMQTLWE